MIRVQRVENHRKRYLDLLLLADEQESMIDRYLERGIMYVLEDEETVAVCVVTEEGEGVLELKNIAVKPNHQRKGYGKAFLEFLGCEYQGKYRVLQVGTGDCPSALKFYQECGFSYSHRIKDFFTQHYDHPMFENGEQLVDMIYLQRSL